MKIGSKVATISSPKSKTQINNYYTSTKFTFYYTNHVKNNIVEKTRAKSSYGTCDEARRAKS